MKERNHLNAAIVMKNLQYTLKFMKERNHLNVAIVIKICKLDTLFQFILSVSVSV